MNEWSIITPKENWGKTSLAKKRIGESEQQEPKPTDKADKVPICPIRSNPSVRADCN